MPKLDVIKVEWLNDEEVHIYPPNSHAAWWARPMPTTVKGEVREAWELVDPNEDVEGYYETPEDVFAAVSEKHDDAPIIVTRGRDQ